MIRDIIQTAHLSLINSWTTLTDIVYPNPHVRGVIRDGNKKVTEARQNFNRLRELLKEESRQLESIHGEERKLLAEKQGQEKKELNSRHAEATSRGINIVRETRTRALQDISLARGQIVISEISTAPPRSSSKARRPSRAKLTPAVVVA